MITGTHVVLYSKDPDADRTFFSDVLQLRSVDAGGGWLIFALPPAEAAFHPAEAGAGENKSLQAGFYLMCDDLPATIKSLDAKNIKCTEVKKERWGILTTIKLPSGGEIGVYQPKHPTAFASGSV
jgi:catechol 2,3-dioxygenase-like lactoylglutathione lyase family enzyme